MPRPVRGHSVGHGTRPGEFSPYRQSALPPQERTWAAAVVGRTTTSNAAAYACSWVAASAAAARAAIQYHWAGAARWVGLAPHFWLLNWLKRTVRSAVFEL